MRKLKFQEKKTNLLKALQLVNGQSGIKLRLADPKVHELKHSALLPKKV